MSIRVTVTCVHCSSTGTYNVGVSDGSSGVQCNQCRKTIRIYMRKGQVYEVKKS
jgi:hypothetical protein